VIKVALKHPTFADWIVLFDVVRHAYAFMEGRIDPPSSLSRMSPESLQRKARYEKLFLAWKDDRLVGCLFLRDMKDHLYLGKLAIDPRYQGQGIGQLMMDYCKEFALSEGYREIELQVRVELIENQVFFKLNGFVQTGTTSHTGYTKPTSITMRCTLEGSS
jgi:ribosomal protein S18 acetylase RimI-like enzyme